uniref:carboxypeptidase regulatory-like domain-containing protein n=1 Tax=Caballeronia sp. LjRoot34 TaxID=3342325 RepID=UPI003F4FCF59
MTKTTKAAIEATTESNTEANTGALTKHHRSAVRKASIALLAAVTTFGMAGGAFAQTVGGGTSDTSSAGNTNGGGLPQIQTQGDVSFTSGGVGLDESHALIREQAHWPLSLRFTGPTSDYLSDVHVRIADAKNAEVLKTDAMGPYMLVKLPPGRYTVYARYKDSEKKQGVTVAGNGGAKADFHWSMQ